MSTAEYFRQQWVSLDGITKIRPVDTGLVV